MKSNLLVKILAVVIVSVLLVVLIKGRKDRNHTAQVDAAPESEISGLMAVEAGPDQADNGLSIDPLQDDFLEDEYGVDVDSPVETMRTLTNETRAVREDSQKLQTENKKLKQEIEKLLKMEESLNKRVTSKFINAEKDAEQKQKELEHTQSLTKNLISKLEKRLEDLQQGGDKKRAPGGQKSANGYDIGAADIPEGLGYDEDGAPVDFDQIVWTNPIDAKVDAKDPTKITLPDFNAEMDKKLPSIAKAPVKEKKRSKEERSIKAYTIPINGTLLGSVSMTAMLGRISSNGIHIPGVTGIMMSGVAKGDWTLSCVSGHISSMTFTFQDGTISTFPEPGTKAKEEIAWFSDRNGIPCITGKRITNAASYLTSRVGLTAAASYANAEAASQFTTQTNNSGGLTSGLTG